MQGTLENLGLKSMLFASENTLQPGWEDSLHWQMSNMDNNVEIQRGAWVA